MCVHTSHGPPCAVRPIDARRSTGRVSADIPPSRSGVAVTRNSRRILAGTAALLAAVALTPPVVAAAAPDTVSVPGSHNSEMGCPGDWQPDCAQAGLTLDPADGVWKGTFALPAGGLRVQGRDERHVGRELRGRRRARRGEHRLRDGGRAGVVLLRPRHALGRPATRRGRSSPRPAASRASWAAPATGRRTACAPGCRTRTATACTRSRPPRSRPGSTRSRPRTACRGTENYGAGGAPRRREHPVHRGRGRRPHGVLLRHRHPRADRHRRHRAAGPAQPRGRSGCGTT